VNLPEPANVERDKINGRLLRIVFIALSNYLLSENISDKNNYLFAARDSK
jgi:hypothetical protein